ncbi:hypothetical protein DL98DRAFT_589045 [Cadophora sp. DSE1049]|nr:hypothetical protein DL98DRAFT_589045 [Cadophora sp. DSE1049]
MSYITLKVAIKSKEFDRFLAINGNGMSSFTVAGAGSVTSSKALGLLSILRIENYDNGTFSIRAPRHPGVFLRLDHEDDKKENRTWAWGDYGTVNYQYSTANTPNPDGKEFFRFCPHPDGSVAIDSVACPGFCLRMDDEGFVNGQWWGEEKPPNLSLELFTVMLLG